MLNFTNKVFHGDAERLLQLMPAASIDAVITDPMYGTAKNFCYDWGVDGAKGDPTLHWQYHRPIYEECCRVLKPNGILAWAQGWKYIDYFDRWFGPHRVWSPLCTGKGLNAIPNIWVVQTKEKAILEHPNNMVVKIDRHRFIPLRDSHPCPKAVEEMAFLIRCLTRPGDLILDCCCGIGATLVAAKQLGRRWLGCDRSEAYCKVALQRLDKEKK